MNKKLPTNVFANRASSIMYKHSMAPLKGYFNS